MDDDSTHVPVTFEHYDHVEGPFYHGTKAGLGPGELLVPGYGSNFENDRVSNNIYFTATLDAAIWGAELAKGDGAGRIYIVEPTGPFEDDPNLTNKRFPGNRTKSYRTRDPLRIAGEIKDWEGHPAEVLQAMRDHLVEMERQGLATIDD
jgi:rifampin ADP-ribosylating transferase